jgi:hypothetical protein
MSDYNENYLNRRYNNFNSRRGDVKMTKAVLTAPRKLKVQIVKELNESALYLFEYYVSAISSPVIDLLDDKVVGRTIGWTTRKTKDMRLRLAKAGYILFHSTVKDNVIYNTWIITKDEVEAFKERNNALKDTPIIVTQSASNSETDNVIRVEVIRDDIEPIIEIKPKQDNKTKLKKLRNLLIDTYNFPPELVYELNYDELLKRYNSL